MKAITFLGIRPTETCYVFPNGQEHTAPFCGVALARFIPELDMRVFVTDAASQLFSSHFLPHATASNVQSILIPDGRTGDELWEIFQKVVDVIEQGEKVIFDITHGFRSLPFLSFLAAAYLRKVKNIRLEGVYFGNFEARDQSVTPNRTPVIDLTHFVELLDWMVGADLFVRFGDARDLANLLRKQHERVKPDWRTDDRVKLSAWSKAPITSARQHLEGVSLALRLVRPGEILDSSAKIVELLPSAVQSGGAPAQPFTLLSQDVSDSFGRIALSKEEQQRDPKRALEVERALIRWYLERDQIFQAVALAREWLISWVMMCLGKEDRLLEKDDREQVEKALGAALQNLKTKNEGSGNEGKHLGLNSIPQQREIIELFGTLGNVRNDLMHAGKRKQPLAADKVVQRVKDLCGKLDNLPLECNVS